MKTLKVNSLDNILSPHYVGDAGYDLIASSDPIIVGNKKLNYDYTVYSSIDYIEYDTGLIIEPELNYHSLIFPRSSISKTNLLLANSVGLIDNGYRGTLKLRFKYIAQPSDYIVHDSRLLLEISNIYKKGDKIGQLVFANTISPSMEISEKFTQTNRSEGGFGSSGQ